MTAFDRHQPTRHPLAALGLLALSVWLLSAVAVALGIMLGNEFIPPVNHPNSEKTRTCVLANWDGVFYANIVNEGYSYDVQARSNVAFFPLFPLLARTLHELFGLSAEWSLVLVSNIAFVGVLAVLAAYAEDKDKLRDFPSWVIVSLAVSPLSLFFRAAYSESLFLLLVVLMMYGIRRNWSLVLIALLCGLCTAARPVGVAAVPVFALHAMRCLVPISLFNVLRGLVLLVISTSGIVAFMMYLHYEFSDSLAFAKTQDNWAVRQDATVVEQIGHAIALRPLTSIYDPTSEVHWTRRARSDVAVFNLEFVTPLVFLASIALVVLGAFRRWLSLSEVLLAIGLLGIPYFLHSYRMSMLGHSRFALVAFPCFLVIGHLLRDVPGPLAALLIGISAVLLAIYSALFAAWYPIV
ncbi:MAG: hypothetical protein J5I93_00685 [Pirellulaceae bacterium]|nr:hypothetical protein [Pirellulaceae bacterium]